MCKYFACMFICAPCVCSIPRGQKRVLDTLELDLWMTVRNCHVGAGETKPELSVGATSVLTNESSLQAQGGEYSS